MSSTLSHCGPLLQWNVLVASAEGSGNRRRVAGWELEGRKGHLTFLGLLRRETLSLFHCVYRFARKFHHRREPLWISARAELDAFIGVMILIEADWARLWFLRVLANDRIPEVRRWRCGAVPTRRHAFESAGFRVDSRSGEVLRDGFGRPMSLDSEMVEIHASERWETDPRPPEAPPHLLSSHSWKKSRLVVFLMTISSDLKPRPWLR